MHRTVDNPLLGLCTGVTVRVQVRQAKLTQKWGKGENMQGSIFFLLPPLLCLHTFYLMLPHLANILYYTLNCK